MPVTHTVSAMDGLVPSYQPDKSPDTLGEAGGAMIRIVRTPKDADHPYGRLSNAVLTPGPDLPLDSRGLLHYLLSKPDGWQVRMGHLRRIIGCGKDKLQRMIKDLICAGYLVRQCTHGPGGRWVWESVLYEAPVQFAAPAPAPLPPNPAPVIAGPDAPPAAEAAIYRKRTPPTTEVIKTEGSGSNPPANAKKGDDDRQPLPQSLFINAVISDYSRELGDEPHLLANITQALRLWRESGRGEADFVAHLHAAKQRTRLAQGKQGTGVIHNKMAYYFSVLRSLLAEPEGIARRN